MENLKHRIPMSLAAILMAFTWGLHVFVGGPEINAPLRGSDLPAELRSTFTVVWHFVSVHLFLMSLALAWLAFQKNTALYWAVFGHVWGFAVLFLLFSWIDFDSLWALPQWTLFLLIGLAMLGGLRK